MLNLAMISNAFWTLRVRGFKEGSIRVSPLLKPFALAIFSRSSMLFEMKELISLILVRIFASVFFSMN